MLKPLDDKRSAELQTELADARWQLVHRGPVYYGFHPRWVVHLNGPTRFGMVQYHFNEEKLEFPVPLVDQVLRQIPVWSLTRGWV